MHKDLTLKAQVPSVSLSSSLLTAGLDNKVLPVSPAHKVVFKMIIFTNWTTQWPSSRLSHKKEGKKGDNVFKK